MNMAIESMHDNMRENNQQFERLEQAILADGRCFPPGMALAPLFP